MPHETLTKKFKEEATPALGGFLAVPLSRPNWTLEMLGIFLQEGGKLEHLEIGRASCRERV